MVFAIDSNANQQESLIQQSNPMSNYDAIAWAEELKKRPNLFGVKILKRVRFRVELENGNVVEIC